MRSVNTTPFGRRLLWSSVLLLICALDVSLASGKGKNAKNDNDGDVQYNTLTWILLVALAAALGVLVFLLCCVKKSDENEGQQDKVEQGNDAKKCVPVQIFQQCFFPILERKPRPPMTSRSPRKTPTTNRKRKKTNWGKQKDVRI